MPKLVAILALLAACGGGQAAPRDDGGGDGGGPDGGDAGVPRVPRLVGDAWQIAHNPDLGAYTSPNQQPVDFAIWQAADGSWQLESCIRLTLIGGNTRLLHRWQGAALGVPDWQPMGIAMTADPSYGETPGGLQAPYVLGPESAGDGLYHLFYGDWEHICQATSADGKQFTRVTDGAGQTGMFSEGAGANTRDPMVLATGGRFIIYYTAFPDGQGADYARTSSDLHTWSPARRVAFGGVAGTAPSAAECPFVVALDGYFYLFRTQAYGQDAITRVYRSTDPLDFGLDDDSHLIGSLPVAAPEVFWSGGQWYLASLMPDLQGIRVSRLSWDESR